MSCRQGIVSKTYGICRKAIHLLGLISNHELIRCIVHIMIAFDNFSEVHPRLRAFQVLLEGKAVHFREFPIFQVPWIAGHVELSRSIRCHT